MKSNYWFLSLAFVLLSFTAPAQSVGIGTTTPDASAALDVTSATGGVLLPRVTAAQRDAIASPAQGLFVFQTDGTPGFYYYVGNSWLNLASSIVPADNGAAGADPRVRVSTLLSQTTAVYKGMAIDGSGNLYICTGSVIIKFVVATGSYTEFAGSSTSTGNVDGTGTAARFNRPLGLALDGSGTFLYVADLISYNIRKIEVATRVVTTVAGGTRGNANGTGSAAQFASIVAITVNSSGTYAYVADGNRIRTIALATGVVTTLAGSTTAGFANSGASGAQFNNPSGLALDASGTILYVADTGNHCIRKILAATGYVTTLAGSGSTSGYTDGTGAAAQFLAPFGVTVDGSGNLYVSDMANNCIRKIEGATGSVSTLAGTSTAGSADGTGPNARFVSPGYLAQDASGTLYVCDDNNNTSRIRVVK